MPELLNYGRELLTKLAIVCNLHRSCLRYCFVIQICDFGLAKWKEQAATQTSTGTRRGTVAYMAPEVFKDPSMSRTVKYDVYSYGILLWELLSEKTPFENGIDIVFVFWNNSDLLCKSEWICKAKTYAL